MANMVDEKGLLKLIEADILLTEAEMLDLSRKYEAFDFIAFPQGREMPLHSLNRLPQTVASIGMPSGFQGTARPGEYFAFQIAVYAHRDRLSHLTVQTEGPLPLECFQIEGTDSKGKKLVKSVDVESHKVQPLWLGVMLPEDAEGCVFAGSVTIGAEGKRPITLPYQIEVKGDVIENHGDDELWRHSRLRWLNSTIAIDDQLVHPFTPLRVEGRTIHCLGRQVELGTDGLPLRIISRFSKGGTLWNDREKDILAAPVAFLVNGSAQGIHLAREAAFTRIEEGVVCWNAAWSQGPLTITLEGKIEFDGYMEFAVTVNSPEAADVNDIALTVPYSKAASVYHMGLGQRGSRLKETLDWKWDETLNQDTLWMGDVDAGLMVRLKDERYQKPYMLIYYHYGPLVMPRGWENEGRGGCRVEPMDGQSLFTAYSGPRAMQPGQSVKFLFDFTVTPVKPIDKWEHWLDRYYHRVPKTLNEVTESGANVINIHHANRLNPVINYPFYETEALKKFITDAHLNGLRVKLYYTVKEITVHMAEFWALRSLSNETMPKTYEIGKSFQGDKPYADDWFAQYLDNDFITAWRQIVSDGPYEGLMEASVMAAPESRFNNYFLEGLKWLLNNTDMDGLYFDDVAFDRGIMKRIRKILNRHKPGCSIDLHGWNYFKNNTVDNSRLAGWANTMNLYIDNVAFMDRIWFGEGFDYDTDPDYWLTEISGIPFGLMGEMLESGGNIWRGMVYGMTNRQPNPKDPAGVWALWDAFGIVDAVMYGYWDESCPVNTGDADIPATAFVKPGKALIAMASWAPEARDITLSIDFEAIGLDPQEAELVVPYIPAYQEAQSFSLGGPIPVPPGKGWLMIVQKKGLSPGGGCVAKNTHGI